MFFTASLPKFELKRAEFSKTLAHQANEQMRQAARAFLRAALPLIPQYTGMSKASWLPLGRFLRVAVSITPKTNRRMDYYVNGVNTGWPKNPATGQMLGEGTFVFEEGSPSNLIFAFVTWNVIDQYIKQDMPPAEYNANKPYVPWQSYEAGKEAFAHYMRTEGLRKMPNVKDFIIRKDLLVKK